MKRKIFVTLITLLLATLLVFSSLWGFVLSKELRNQTKDALKNIRVTILNLDGDVVFDNRYDIKEMENHRSREEVLAAIEKGWGESERVFEATGDTTYYYAVKLKNNQILRMSLREDDFQDILGKFMPLMAASLVATFLVSVFLSRVLTRRLVKPINNMDLDSLEVNEYEELYPFVKRIQAQKAEITQQMQEIQRRSSTIDAITQNMGEGLLLLDQKGRILLSNEAVSKIFKEDELLGMDVIHLCRDSDFMGKIHSCLLGEEGEMDLLIGEHMYQLLFSPVSHEGGTKGAAVFFIDKTENYISEVHRKEFTANVSHELKTPLTAIIGYSELMAGGSVKDKDIIPFAEKINAQASRLLNIINDIISLSEFDEGEKSREFTKANPYKLAEEVIRQLEDKGAEKHVKLTLMGISNMEIMANSLLLESMIYNLVDNGIKYNTPGGKVDVCIADAGEYVKIIVSDTGIGIPKEHRSRIFERFYLVDKSRSKKTGGTGLGLSIVKHIAEYHGGYVKLQSQESAGTTFTCYIKK